MLLLHMDHFLHIRVPFPAGRAFPDPLGRLRTAVLAEKNGFGFGGHYQLKIEIKNTKIKKSEDRRQKSEVRIE
jgi:hypothetical protein